MSSSPQSEKTPAERVLAESSRSVAVITGACGGMGRSIARLLGRRHHLVLTDTNAASLATFAATLTEEGLAPALTLAGDMSEAAFIARLVDETAKQGRLGALIHTAGLSPSMASWDRILKVNATATLMLLNAFEPKLEAGSVCVMIASMAGHLVPGTAESDLVMDDALAPDFFERAKPFLEALARDGDEYGLSSPAYYFSKRAVHRQALLRALDWGRRGARIVTVSPGIIATPMGRQEVERNPTAAAVVTGTPAGRWGTALDIANAVDFLSSEQATFITGSDILVDGGAVALRRLQSGH